MARRALSLLGPIVGWAFASSPSVALACASCALKPNEPGRQLLSLAMIVLPFTVVGISVYAIRRLARRETSVDGSVAADSATKN